MSEEVQAELYFLILHFLHNGPCSAAAKVLEQDALRHGLLPKRTDIYGTLHTPAYEELRQRFKQVPVSGLLEVLKRWLELSKRESVPGACGLTSLLNCGQLSVFQPNTTTVVKPRVPEWNRLPHKLVSVVSKLALRELGLKGLSSVNCTAFSSEYYVKQLQHHRTIRGHRFAVYCVCWDRQGRRIITGSDDRVVKIWSAHAAMLLSSCRGHDGDITDLSVNCDNTLVASSSNDGTVRCWSLQDDTIGHPVSVLSGHTLPVTYVDFCPTLPDAVLTSSTDGTCRIWHARNTMQPSILLRPSPTFGPTRGITRFGTNSHPAGAAAVGAPPNTTAQPLHQQGSDAEQLPTEAATQEAQTLSSLLVCSFSKDGSYIVAGSAECHTYVWFWDIFSNGNAHKEQRAAEFDLQNGPWPEPTEVCKLSGHKNDVVMLQFSHAGDAIATGSKDGSVRVWRQMMRRGRKLNLWQIDLVLSCQPDEETVRQARRRRRALPNPSVNQVAWSHDDKMVVAAITDHTIHVFDALSGELRHRLKAHTASVHVLECHPSNHRLAMSAGYDGNLMLWDIVKGQKLGGFSSQDTCPLGHRWCDPIQLVDGHFSPDGSSIAVTDVAGQVHIYGCGAAHGMSRAMYDQFWSSESSPLLRDERHYVIDAETQLPAHVRGPRDTFCDLLGNPYPEPYQSAFKEQRVTTLPSFELQHPPALILQPPTITAAAWQAQEDGGNEEDILHAVQRAHERAMRADHEGPQENAAATTENVMPSQQPEPGENLSAEGGAGSSEQQEAAAVAAAPSTTTEQDVVEEGADRMGVRQSRRVREMALQAAAERVETHRASRRQRHMQPEFTEPLVLARRRAHTNPTLHSSEEDEDEGVGSSDREAAADSSGSECSEAEARTMQGEREAGRTRRQGRASASRAPEGTEGRLLNRARVVRRKRSQHGGRPSKRRRFGGGISSDDDVVMISSDDDEVMDEEPSSIADWEHDEEDDHVSLRRSRRRSIGYNGRGRRKAKAKEKKKRRSTTVRQRSNRPTSGRLAERYQWLQVTHPCPGVYVPQMGDAVVYLRHGHALYLDNTHDKRRPPWEQLAGSTRRGVSVDMRPAEPCEVTALYYIETDDGQNYTTAKLTLRLCDAASPLFGREFTIVLPPPTFGHPEFVILRARYEAAVIRNFKVGDRCQVYYPDDEGKWWVGTVSQDTCRVGPRRLAEDMWGHNDMWDRYVLTWDNNQAGPSSSASDVSDSSISPWEMYDEGVTAEGAAAEQTRLDENAKQRLLTAVNEALKDRRYYHFHRTVQPEEWFECEPGSSEGCYYTSEIPLPLSLTTIRERLVNGYYRQAAAVQHDINLIRLNAAKFTGSSSPVTRTAEALQEYFMSLSVGGDANPAVETHNNTTDEEGNTLQAEEGDDQVNQQESEEMAHPCLHDDGGGDQHEGNPDTTIHNHTQLEDNFQPPSSHQQQQLEEDVPHAHSDWPEGPPLPSRRQHRPPSHAPATETQQLPIPSNASLLPPRRSGRQHTHVNYRELEAMPEVEEALSHRNSRARHTATSRTHRNEAHVGRQVPVQEYNPNLRRSSRSAVLAAAGSAGITTRPSLPETRARGNTRHSRNNRAPQTTQLDLPARPRRATRQPVLYGEYENTEQVLNSHYDDDFEEEQHFTARSSRRSRPPLSSGIALGTCMRSAPANHTANSQQHGRIGVRLRLSHSGSTVLVNGAGPADSGGHMGGSEQDDGLYATTASPSQSHEPLCATTKSRTSVDTSDQDMEEFAVRDEDVAGPSDIGGLPMRLRRFKVKLQNQTH